MGLTIGSNLASNAVLRHIENSSVGLSKSYEKLASGHRIVRAGDDAAGLAIAETTRGKIQSVSQAIRNAGDGVAFAQVAEGGMTEISDMMIRLRELAIQASSDTVGDRERLLINQEAQSIVQEVDRLANVTNYNGVQLLNGQAPKSNLEFQVGITSDENSRIVFDAGAIDVRAGSLGIDGISYESIDNARDALERVDEAMTKIFSARASLGATQNKLQSATRTLEVNRENLVEAHSRIADTDIASETSELVRGNILQAAGVAVLAQANNYPNVLLRLIG